MSACDGRGWQEVHAAVPGLSYRQLDYWSRTGRLASHQHDRIPDGRLAVVQDGDRGSGRSTCWPAVEVGVARHVVEFLAAGFTLDAAFGLARDRTERRRVAVLLMDDDLEAVRDGYREPFIDDLEAEPVYDDGDTRPVVDVPTGGLL